jgi:MFS transporter, YNFM family, putative membrane transport protein
MEAPPANVRVLGGMSPFLLGAGAMFATMYSTQAILPQLGDSFGVSPAEAGLTISVLVVALAVGAWIWGPLSDRIGLRRSLTLASALLVVPALVVPLAPTFALLLVARVAEGLVMPGLLTVGVGYIADVYKPRIGSRAMGYYVSTLVVGGLIGRLGVAFLTDLYGWRVAMAALAVLPAVAAVVVRRSLEPDPVRHSQPAVEGARLALLRNRTLIGASAAGASLFFGFVGVFSFIDYRLESAPFSYSPSVASLIFVLWIFGAVGPAAGSISGRVGWRRVAVAGVVTALTGVILTLSGAMPLIVLGLALFAAAMFAGVTACQLGVASSTDHNRGFATAVYFSAYYIAGALGGYLPGLAWQSWGWGGVGALAIAVLAAGLTALVATASRSPQRALRATRAELSNGVSSSGISR